MLLVVEQFLNGLQFGLLLFLLAAGLTLVFGIMDLVNLAHGSLYMIGAFAAAWAGNMTGSFLVALLAPGSARNHITLAVLKHLHQLLTISQFQLLLGRQFGQQGFHRGIG